ncbi:MAG: hypothetical protein AAGA75_28325 [Cyanobacteria bacterium P01_E01_bin.6]
MGSIDSGARLGWLLEAVSTDRVCDMRECYDASAEREAQANISPCEDAQHREKEEDTHTHNRTFKRI